MAMYGGAILPFIAMLGDPNLTRKWYADKRKVADSLETTLIMPDKLNEHVGTFGYNVIKCHLITEPEVVQNHNCY